MIKKKQKKTKGFKWNKFIVATTQKVLDEATLSYVIYGGNFFHELKLPNALKLNSFGKLKDKVEKYVKSHGGKEPQQITVNQRQLEEYIDIFPDSRNPIVNKYSNVITFNGIPLKPYGTNSHRNSSRI